MFPEVLNLVVDEFTLLVQLSPLLELSDELLAEFFEFVDSSLVLVDPLL